MRSVRLTALAEFDLIEAQDFYAPKGAWVLDHFISCVTAGIEQLTDLAGVHPMRFGHHRAGVPHFPFSIYYDIDGDAVIIKAILDDRFGPARIVAHFGPTSNLDHRRPIPTMANIMASHKTPFSNESMSYLLSA